MSYSIQNLKNDITAQLHGTTSNQIQNFDGAINRAARQLLLDVDPQETKRTVEFVNPIFNGVFDYPIASDVKGNKLIDIFPQVRRLPSDIWTQAYNQAFDVAKQNIFSMSNMFTVNFNSSIKTLRVNAPFLNPPVIINQADNLTNNGTWTTGDSASNLTIDNTNYAQGTGSLKFDCGFGANSVINSTMTPVDLSAVAGQSSLFVWAYMPSGADFIQAELFWGSSASDCYYQVVTQNQQGTAFVNGWNLLQFNTWNIALGTPDPSAISYLKLNLVTNVTQVGARANGFDSILGTVLNYSYYSKYLFRNASTNAYQETVLADSDLINLDTESFNLLTNLVGYYVTQQMQGLDAQFYDGTFFKQAYDAGLLRYKSMYKSELQKPQSTYYSQPKPSYSRIAGRGWYN